MNDSTGQWPDDGDRSVAGRIARVLAARIVTGALRPGQKVLQDQVAAEFGASHVPVREAFRTLEGQGLLIGEPGRGVRVAPLDPMAVTEATAMRAALEGLALRHAMARMAPGDLEAAKAALADGEASTDIAVWEDANRRFHRAITAPCAMPRLIRTIDDLHRAGARLLFAAWRTLDWQPRSDREHRAILDRIRAGDAQVAVDALTWHILAAGQALKDSLAAGDRT